MSPTRNFLQLSSNPRIFAATHDSTESSTTFAHPHCGSNETITCFGALVYHESTGAQSLRRRLTSRPPPPSPTHQARRRVIDDNALSLGLARCSPWFMSPASLVGEWQPDCWCLRCRGLSVNPPSACWCSWSQARRGLDNMVCIPCQKRAVCNPRTNSASNIWTCRSGRAK